MSGFRKWSVYSHALEGVKRIYVLLQDPRFKHDFSLSDQIKRAAMSVVANIAEGYGRTTNKDKAHFLTIAIGSVNEVIAFLDIIASVYELDTKEIQDFFDHLGRKISNLRKSILTPNN